MNQQSPWPPLKYVRAEVFVGVTIAAFTFGQIIVGHWQYVATRNQYYAMDDQIRLMQAEQRPWLWVDMPDDKQPAPGARTEFAVEIRNNGKTPAIVSVRGLEVIPFKPGVDNKAGRLDLSETGRPILKLNIDRVLNRIQSDQGQSRTIIPPNSVVTFSKTLQETLGGIIEEKMFKSGDIVPVVVALVVYSDAINGQYRTYATFIHDHATGRFDTLYQYSDIK